MYENPEQRLTPRPRWTNLLFGHAWVTIAPRIYHPVGVVPTQFPALIAHEMVHITQQTSGSRIWWFLHYYLSRSFRLQQEAEAIAKELTFYTPIAAVMEMADYAHLLSGPRYLWAAPDTSTAMAALTTARVALGQQA